MPTDEHITIDSLLLPQTPQRIREAYLNLPARAATRDFDLLVNDIIVLDTETTGLSFKDDCLIEISAVRLANGEVDERFQTYVNPSRPIPVDITKLTGITNLDVANAPDAEQAVGQLAEFTGGMPVIAHNATFDRTFVERVPGGKEVSEQWIDTLALSRIALPMLSTHRLSDLAKAFGCAAVTHNSTDDVDALCGVWKIILCGLELLPSELLAKLATMHEEVDWPYRFVFSYLASLSDDHTPFSLRDTRARITNTDEQVRPDCNDLVRLDCPTSDEVAAEFESDGIVASMYNHMEKREDQVKMAREVTDALATSTHRAIEAGTGVGKSIAYLLPEALFAKRNNVTVGVATKTNALTDQLMTHELPALANELPGGLTYVSLKGYDHYPCLWRLECSVTEDLPLSLVNMNGRSENTVLADMLTAIAVTYAFACQSPDGDLDALGIRWNNVPRQLLTVSSDECLHRSCPFFNGCFLYGARQRAGCADVVVTNHSLLLRDVASEGRILPPIRNWVIDEAHSFESEARKQWASEMSARDSHAVFEQLGGVQTGILHDLFVTQLLSPGVVTKASSAVSSASLAMGDFFVAVHELVSLVKGGGGYDTLTLWINDEVRVSKEWSAVSEQGVVAIEDLETAIKALNELTSSLSDAQDSEASQLSGRLKGPARTLQRLHDAMKLICEGSDDSYVYSAQLSRSKRGLASEKLVAERLDVGSSLATRWLSEMRSVIFTSATLAVGKSDFSRFNASVGLSRIQKDQYREIKLGSSFDFDRQMAVVVAKDLPAPDTRRPEPYLSALTNLLFDVHVSMGGSVLTLFTNRREMERVFADLEPRLASAGLELVCQEPKSSPRNLRKRLLEEKNLSLFALKSFWEGFDAPGDALRCVVIAKLPFTNPSDPLMRERELHDSRAWANYSLPEAVISVKQAAGRLIRSSSDTGVLVLADSRVANKAYGKIFLNSLPSQNINMLESKNVGRYIKEWRRSHEKN